MDFKILINNLDIQIYNYFINGRIPVLNNLFIFITSLAEFWVVLFIFFITIFLLYRFKHKLYIKFLTINLLVGEAFVFLLKIFFSRERPPLENSIVTEPTYSFPSGHSVTSIVLYFSILIIINNLHYKFSRFTKTILNIILISLIILIPLSRLYLGVHWFSDVAGGIILGLLVVLTSKVIFKIKNR